MPVRITTVFTLVLSMIFDHALGRHVLVDAGGVVDVIVHIDDVELRLVDRVRGDVKHGDGMKIPQQERLLLLGIGGRLVADLGRRGWRRSGRARRLRPAHRDAEKKRHHHWLRTHFASEFISASCVSAQQNESKSK